MAFYVNILVLFAWYDHETRVIHDSCHLARSEIKTTRTERKERYGTLIKFWNYNEDGKKIYQKSNSKCERIGRSAFPIKTLTRGVSKCQQNLLRCRIKSRDLWKKRQSIFVELTFTFRHICSSFALFSSFILFWLPLDAILPLKWHKKLIHFGSEVTHLSPSPLCYTKCKTKHTNINLKVFLTLFHESYPLTNPFFHEIYNILFQNDR